MTGRMYGRPSPSVGQHGSCMPFFVRGVTLLHLSKYHDRTRQLSKMQHEEAEADRGKDTPGTDDCLSLLHAPPHADPTTEGVLSIVSQIIDRLRSWELSVISSSAPSNHSCNKCAASASIMTASMTSKNSVDNVYIEQLDTEDPHMERRVLRKIDFRLLPILGALYTIALIDRTNISVARISGLDDDLDLKVGNRASVVLLVTITRYLTGCRITS